MPETKTMFSLASAELGHEALDGGEDRVVTAAGAPAHLLVGLEVLHGLLGLGLGHQRKHVVASVRTSQASMASLSAVASCSALNGMPLTWV